MTALPSSRGLLPNPQMQPTGRSGPELRSDASLLVAKLWKRHFVRTQTRWPAADLQVVRRTRY